MKNIKSITKELNLTQLHFNSKFLKAAFSITVASLIAMNSVSFSLAGGTTGNTKGNTAITANQTNPSNPAAVVTTTPQKNDIQVKISDKNLETIIRKLVYKPKEPILKSDIVKICINSTSTIFYRVFKWDEFFGTPKNSLDVLFFGSSHAYRSFDPDVFDKNLGIHSFNFGESGQYPIADYYQLVEALKTQKPKLIVYEAYWKILELKENTSPTYPAYNFEPLKPNPKKSDPNKYMKELFLHKSSYGSWTKLLKDNKISIDEYYKDKGYVSNVRVAPISYIKNDPTHTYDKPDNFPQTINKDELLYFNKFVDLCNKNNIKILFVTAPIPPISLGKVTNYQEIHDYFANIAEKNNSDYVDYNYLNMDGKMFPNNYFKDSNHLNATGANSLSNNLSDYIKTNCADLFPGNVNFNN